MESGDIGAGSPLEGLLFALRAPWVRTRCSQPVLTRAEEWGQKAMCRIAKADFGSEASTPSAARAWIGGLLHRWEVPWLAEPASLLTSELVTNAIRHAHSGPSVTAAIADGYLEVGVTDGKPNAIPRVFSPDDPTADGKRGMAIVDALAADWGTNVLPKGKQVWFRLEATDWTYLTACRCHGDHLGKVILDSGRQVLANPGPWDGSV